MSQIKKKYLQQKNFKCARNLLENNNRKQKTVTFQVGRNFKFEI